MFFLFFLPFCKKMSRKGEYFIEILYLCTHIPLFTTVPLKWTNCSLK